MLITKLVSWSPDLLEHAAKAVIPSRSAYVVLYTHYLPFVVQRVDSHLSRSPNPLLITVSRTDRHDVAGRQVTPKQD